MNKCIEMIFFRWYYNKQFASNNKNLNIITGPNMGGKSVFIRQVALLQIIAQVDYIKSFIF